MKTAIGTKVIRFEPMTQKEFGEKFKPNTGDVTLQNIDGYHVQYDNPDGSVYDSWSPKDVFEAAYVDISEETTFENAMFMMRRGKKVMRFTWSGELLLSISKDGCIVVGDDESHLWIPDTLDLVADDWIIVDA